jgi:hypothetical protein
MIPTLKLALLALLLISTKAMAQLEINFSLGYQVIPNRLLSAGVHYQIGQSVVNFQYNHSKPDKATSNLYSISINIFSAIQHGQIENHIL